MSQTLRFVRALGPGLIYAGAAIGTSHLVQSTRAGAVYGLGLLVIILVSHLLKYPSFRFGPLYVAATGASLVEGYRSLGRWAVVLLSLSHLAVHAIIIAATAITTAAIAYALTSWETIPITIMAAGFVAVAAMLVLTGGYKLLEALIKPFVAVLCVLTVIAAILVVPRLDWSLAAFAFPAIDVATLAFIVALMGFMPAPLDMSILYSLWAKAKTAQQPHRADWAMLEFHASYIGTGLMAVCFLIMGAGVMHVGGTEPANSAPAFAAQVISLYTTGLGAWAGIVVAICAFGVMLSTLVTIVDGFPRMHAAAYESLARAPGDTHAPLDGGQAAFGSTKTSAPLDGGWPQRIALGVLCLAAIGILTVILPSFFNFIDFVTITAFLSGPIIAVGNHLVITGATMPEHLRPSRPMQIWSIVGIIGLSSICAVYLVSRLSM